MDALFAQVSDAEENSTCESIVKVLKFFLKIEENYEPAIFILNVKITDGMFRIVFDHIIDQLNKTNTFAEFNDFSESFNTKVSSILTVDRDNSKILFNPKHLTVGKYDNSAFTIEEVNVTDNTQAVRKFIETSKFNFRSFINTVTKKMKFSYSIRRDTINNRKINPTLTTIGNDLFITEKVRDQSSPWLSTNKLVKFKILIDGEKCISGGRPGIPGSIYITLDDRTSIILFKKGTCLIVGSKMNQRRCLSDFIAKTLSNIHFLITLFSNYSKTKLHDDIITSTKIVTCSSESCVGNYTCEECLIKTAVMNELNFNRNDNIKIEYLRYYNKYYNDILREVSLLESLMKDIECGKPLHVILERLSTFCDDNTTSITTNSKTSVFGLKKREMIHAGLFIQMPTNHKKNVSLFTGNRITFRSLKNTSHGEAIINLYDHILDDVRNFKHSMGNVFQYSEEELITMVDNYSNLFGVNTSSE